MSVVRLFVAWLLMATLPLQGFAAASMLLCGQAKHAASAPIAHDHASHSHAKAPAGHDAHPGHAGHGHASADVSSAAEDSPAHHASAAQAEPSGHQHTCSICASCCHPVALMATSALSLPEAAPATLAAPGPARFSTREAPAPDKPPRG